MFICQSQKKSGENCISADIYEIKTNKNKKGYELGIHHFVLYQLSDKIKRFFSFIGISELKKINVSFIN